MSKQDKALRDRMAGDYTPPILVEPAGGPIPPWRPIEALPDIPTRKA